MPLTDIRYEHIRQLVRRFYDGDTSAAEEAEIHEFFASADLSTLPSDLREEADIFCAIHSSAAQPPADILADIDKQILKESVRVAPRPRYNKLLWVAAAALVGLVIGLAIFKALNLNSSGSISPEQPLVSTVTQQPDKEQENTEDVAGTPAPEPAPMVPVGKSHTPKRALAVSKTLADEGYNEISDPEEAARMLARIDRMVSNSLKTASDTRNRVASEMNEIDEIITTTMNQVHSANTI